MWFLKHAVVDLLDGASPVPGLGELGQEPIDGVGPHSQGVQKREHAEGTKRQRRTSLRSHCKRRTRGKRWTGDVMTQAYTNEQILSLCKDSDTTKYVHMTTTSQEKLTSRINSIVCACRH